MPEATEIKAARRTSGARTLLLLGALVAATVFIVYLPVLGNGFVNWDDGAYVYRNLHIRSLDIRWAFSSVVVGTWLPLTLLSYTLDYAIWGLNPLGYHLTNNLLHALNSALVLVLGARLYAIAAHGEGAKKGALWAGFVAALLFGLHPLRVESVAWIAERKDVLCAFFFLLAALAYIEYASVKNAPGRGLLWYAASLVLFILALLAKPMAVTLPAVLLILDLYPLGRLTGRRGAGAGRAVAEKIPFFALSVAASATALWAQRLYDAVAPLSSAAPFDRVLTAINASVFYLYKTIAPVGLAPLYPRPSGMGGTGASLLSSPASIVSLAVFLVLTAVCVLTFRRRRYIGTAMLCYAVTLLPVSGIIRVGSQAAADRYTYLPTIGLFVLAGALAGRVIARQKARRGVGRGVGRMVVAATVLAAVIALSWATVRQTRVWKDSLTLWSYEIARYPGQVALAYT
ncbi:MAG: hypothetical protein ACE5GY_09610, partial [Thermodesulfobacteriota bacterium]